MGRKSDGPARVLEGQRSMTEVLMPWWRLGISDASRAAVNPRTGTVGLNSGMERESSLTNGFRKIKSSGFLG